MRPLRHTVACVCSQELFACCWLSSKGTPETHGDALLAVGGADNAVSVISVASAAVVSLLKGHAQARARRQNDDVRLTACDGGLLISARLHTPFRPSSTLLLALQGSADGVVSRYLRLPAALNTAELMFAPRAGPRC